jgi:uncharacterized membrane protein
MSVTLATALACGLVSGVFFAFSSFVMPALRALSPAQGLAAMQSINVKAVTPVFMTALFGTAAACVAVAVASPGGYRLAGAATYLVGTIALTMAFHVPRNDALVALDPGDPGAAAGWARYLREWTAGNHVRAAAALVAAGLLAVA